MSQYQVGALYLWPFSELEEYGEVDCDDDGEGEQELRQAGDHGVGHLPLALPRVLPQQSEQGCHFMFELSSPLPTTQNTPM